MPALAEKVTSLPASTSVPTDEMRKAAFVTLGQPSAPSSNEGWLQRLTRRFTSGAAPREERATISIPFDGPTDISLRSRQAVLNEGELFGEMACLNRTPRSATVMAARDCYILEMLSNILTEIDKDPGYQAERNRVYKDAPLDLQPRDLSIFRDLTDQEFVVVAAEIRGSLELIGCKAGDLICDEHDRSDHVYLVRSGLVQVKKNVTRSRTRLIVTNWPKPSRATACRCLPLPHAASRDLAGQAFQPGQHVQ